MIVAVLGANGQLGSDLVRVAREFQDMKTLPLTRQHLDVCDLASIPQALAEKEFDAVVNCTSYHKTDEVEGRATEAFRVNAHAVAAIAKVCKSHDVRFVYISTDYVFDGESTRPYTETDPVAPVNVYGASKLLGEKFATREYPNGTLIARVASLFGVAGSSGKGGNFVETILSKARESGEVRVVNDVTMSPTSTADAARVILKLLESDAAAGTYHVVNSGLATWFEFARQIVEEAGIQAKVVPVSSSEYPTAAIRPSYTALDNRKAAELAGKIPSWSDALHRYLAAKRYLQPCRSAAVIAGT
ncbi:MAG TPA: dTDP-4-dehydrorhamnose reductase [Candidatus Acidoferrum sp.]|nr:dTDP-4-dehydrorhamnose reductase [Candidatus Acidoferrum sp.]